MDKNTVDAFLELGQLAGEVVLRLDRIATLLLSLTERVKTLEDEVFGVGHDQH